LRKSRDEYQLLPKANSQQPTAVLYWTLGIGLWIFRGYWTLGIGLWQKNGFVLWVLVFGFLRV